MTAFLVLQIHETTAQPTEGVLCAPALGDVDDDHPDLSDVTRFVADGKEVCAPILGWVLFIGNRAAEFFIQQRRTSREHALQARLELICKTGDHLAYGLPQVSGRRNAVDVGNFLVD